MPHFCRPPGLKVTSFLFCPREKIHPKRGARECGRERQKCFIARQLMFRVMQTIFCGIRVWDPVLMFGLNLCWRDFFHLGEHKKITGFLSPSMKCACAQNRIANATFPRSGPVTMSDYPKIRRWGYSVCWRKEFMEAIFRFIFMIYCDFVPCPSEGICFLEINQRKSMDRGGAKVISGRGSCAYLDANKTDDEVSLSPPGSLLLFRYNP